MANHWQEAQQKQREETGTNIVLLSDGNVALIGCKETGWMLITPEITWKAQTDQGVELAMEELGLPPLGWS